MSHIPKPLAYSFIPLKNAQQLEQCITSATTHKAASTFLPQLSYHCTNCSKTIEKEHASIYYASRKDDSIQLALQVKLDVHYDATIFTFDRYQ